MVEQTAAWQLELRHWLEPFLMRLAHPARRAMCPLYVAVSTAERIGSKRRSKLPSLKGAIGLAKVHSCWRFKLGVDYRQRVDVAVGGWPAGGSSRHSSREYGRGG